MPNVAKSILAPYGVTDLKLKVTGIAIDGSGNATVTWSWAQDGIRAYSAGSAVSAVPSDMKKANSFLVRSELTIPYQMFSFGPDFLSSGLVKIAISRQYFHGLRQGSSLVCSDC
jgi:hypothetical protein